MISSTPKTLSDQSFVEHHPGTLFANIKYCKAKKQVSNKETNKQTTPTACHVG